MACVVNELPPQAEEDEREEGEIVDDLDELSDISSEEEFLLRQRLQVLENYNNVLERKEAKRSVTTNHSKKKISECQDLSDVSLSNFDEILDKRKSSKVRYSQHKNRRRKDDVNLENSNGNIVKESRKKHRSKKLPPVTIKESSDESDSDNTNKRMKLTAAISVKKNKTDTSLKFRLMNMLSNSKTKVTVSNSESKENMILDASKMLMIRETEKINEDKEALKTSVENKKKVPTVIKLDNNITCKEKDFCEDTVKCNENKFDFMDLAKKSPDEDDVSDEDLEALRKFALQSKAQKAQENKKQTSLPSNNASELPNQLESSTNKTTEENQSKINTKLDENSEDEDSDTAELRLICLRSSLLKKAIEMKQKQKLRKRRTQSSLYDQIIAGDHEDISKDKGNNTDTESIDMEIGSDHDDKDKNKSNIIEENKQVQQPDDLDEDEDLLRAKLLTSLSKNLPLLVDENSLNVSVEEIKTNEKANLAAKVEEKFAPLEKRFIINTADSDSEGEHEATKNLTKMHMKLSDTVEFQQRLDSFLKSTRMQVESGVKPNQAQQTEGDQPITQPTKTPEKFVPKTVKHLPKTEQIEYKNLVKRMAELEKMRQARQVFVTSNTGPLVKETLKPRNVTLDTKTVTLNTMQDIDEQITLSRKRIAEESAKVLKLKEEGFNLSQKYKIVATELRNLATAITFNKKNQKTAQIKLSKIRAQHQVLLRRSNMYSHTKPNAVMRTEIPPMKIQQKENAINKLENLENVLKSVKVSVVNDLQRPAGEDFSVQVDVGSNKKIIKQKSSLINSGVEYSGDINMRMIDTGQTETEDKKEMEICVGDDYESPLQALTSKNWDEDPHGVLCPFVVDGSCKDVSCKYLHPKSFPDP